MLSRLVLGVALAAVLARHAPAVALALVWVLRGAQVATGTRLLLSSSR